MISKTTIADILGIDDSAIPESVYTWAKKLFFMITGLEESETQKTYRRFVAFPTAWLRLPDRNVKSIDSLVVGTSTVSITMDTNVFLNEDTGLISYTGGFTDKIVVGYTISAYTHTDIHDLLVTLYTLKGLATFSPQEVNSLVKKVTIGKYSKTFGGVDSSLYSYLVSIDNEITKVNNLILGDDGQIKIGAIQ